MATTKWLDTLLDLGSLAVDISTKRAVSQMTMGGKPLGPKATKAAGFFNHIASELGLGWEDEADFTIELSKLQDENEKTEIRNLIRILNKRQLHRLALITFNSPKIAAKTQTIRGKRMGNETVDEKEVELAPEHSGGVLFLSALAKLLKDEPDDASKIALMQKLNHLPTTKSFVERAEDRIKAVLRKKLELKDEEELTLGLVAEKLVSNIEYEAVNKRLKEFLGDTPDPTMPRPQDKAGWMVRLARMFTPGAFPNAK
jgi:hypothetical protein